MNSPEVHWEMARTNAGLKAWAETRELGLTVAQCDAITDAVVDEVRRTLEAWELQEQRSEPVDGCACHIGVGINAACDHCSPAIR